MASLLHLLFSTLIFVSYLVFRPITCSQNVLETFAPQKTVTDIFGYTGLSKVMPGYKHKYKSTLSFYKFHLDFATWSTAKEICESEGAHLAIINSEEERDVLLDFWSDARLTKEYENFGEDKEQINYKREYQMEFYIFLGFHDQNKDGKFETIFGNTLNSTGFDKWDDYEPNNEYPGENCGSLHFSSGQLNDIECNAKLRFICEREAYLCL